MLRIYHECDLQRGAAVICAAATRATRAFTEEPKRGPVTLMDNFDLNWPQSDATFFTDGWRCRIVWRERRGGLGGTIDNNDQAKRRVAASLTNAPYLLSALRARGHGLLAEEIESLCEPDLMPEQSDRETPKNTPRSAASKPETDKVVVRSASAPGGLVARWLSGLDGESGWEITGVRRAKTWQPCGENDQGAMFLKAPPSGKTEWVLKRTYRDRKRKTEYLAAPALKGICEYLHQHNGFADTLALEAWFAEVEGLAHPELAKAASAWRNVTKATTH